MSTTDATDETTTVADVSMSAGQLFDRLWAAEEITSEGVFELTEDGLRLAAAAPSESAGIDVTIPIDDGARIGDPVRFEAQIENLADQAAVVAGRHDTVNLRYYYDDHSLQVYADREHVVGVALENESMPGEPSIDFPEYDAPTVEASVRSTELVGIVSGCAHATDDPNPLALVADDDAFAIALSEDSSGYTYMDAWPVPERATQSVSTDPGDEVVAYYPPSYLQDAVNGLPMRWNVTVEFAAEFPLRISVTDDWQYIIAPRLIMDDGGSE